MDKLTFITPQTDDELTQYWQPLAYLFSQLPESVTTPFDVWLKSWGGSVTIIYCGELLVGAFGVELFKRSAEIHGVFSPRLNERLDANVRRVIKQTSGRVLIMELFKSKAIKKLVAKVPAGNKAGRMWCAGYGFKPLQGLDKGRVVYVLNKEDFA